MFPRKTVNFLLFLLLLIAGCSFPPLISVPEIDEYKIEGIGRLNGKTIEEVQQKLGKPSAVRKMSNHRTIWLYPIRNVNHTLGRLVPAPMLNIIFDHEGIIINWTFIHPRTMEPLSVRETLSEADSLRERLCNPHPRIVLNEVLRIGLSTKQDVGMALKWWRPDLEWYGQAGINKRKTNKGEIWTYYVERPSPLFFPPDYIEVNIVDGVFSFYGIDGLSSYRGYPGCNPL